jgi:hypothetical protein
MHGKGTAQLRLCFYIADTKAELNNIHGFIFHDTRRCCKTYASEGGVPGSVVMTITCRSTRLMFDPCKAIDQEDLHATASRVGSYLREISKTIRQDLVSS